MPCEAASTSECKLAILLEDDVHKPRSACDRFYVAVFLSVPRAQAPTPSPSETAR